MAHVQEHRKLEQLNKRLREEAELPTFEDILAGPLMQLLLRQPHKPTIIYVPKSLGGSFSPKKQEIFVGGGYTPGGMPGPKVAEHEAAHGLTDLQFDLRSPYSAISRDPTFQAVKRASPSSAALEPMAKELFELLADFMSRTQGYRPANPAEGMILRSLANEVMRNALRGAREARVSR